MEGEKETNFYSGVMSLRFLNQKALWFTGDHKTQDGVTFGGY